MATIYIPIGREREFEDHYLTWKRATVPSLGFGRIDMMPPRGMSINGETEFVRVEEDFLPYLKKQGFPFRA